MAGWLRLSNDRTYSWNDLQSGEIIQTGKTSFEKNTLKFAHDWLSGRPDFQIQTSGSTGTPKSIKFRRQQLEASAKLTIEALHIEAHGTVLLCLNTNLVAGMMMLVRSFVGNLNCIAIEPSANPLQLLDETNALSLAALVPYQLESILESSDSSKLDNIQNIIIGGAPVSTSLKEKAMKVKSAIYETYGMTETLTHIALKRLNGNHPEEHFTVLPGVSIATDIDNCLIITAPHLEGEIRTHDIVRKIDGTRFRWLGRKDLIINSGGVKVLPEQIEKQIQSIFDDHEISARFFIAGIPHPSLGSQVALIIEGEPLQSDLQKKIQEKINTSTPEFERPRSFHFLSLFEETGSGKIDRLNTLALLEPPGL